MHHLLPAKADSAVILLHGLGADGADLIALGHEWRQALPNTAFYAPDAPFACDMAPMGYQWFSLREWTTASITAGLDSAKPAADKMIDDVMRDLNLPASKIVLAGFSQGCMLSLHTGLQRKETLAGILGMSGALFLAPGQITSKPPVALTHGTADTVVPVQGSQMAEQILQAVGAPVALHLIEGMGHGIDSTCLDLGAKFLHRVLA